MTLPISALDLLRNEIAQLKADGARRNALSAHACAYLFYQVGVRPTVANVREITGAGSAGDIARDIEAFWQQVRQRGQLAADGVPPGLQHRAGELVSGLYGAALAEARGAQAMRLMAAEQAAQQALARQNALEEEVDDLRRRCAEQAAQLSVRARDETIDGTVRHMLEQYAAGDRADLLARLESAEANNRTLRAQVEALQTEMTARATDYAAQLKDALSAAEARVRPLLVELDDLRQRVAAADRAAREAPRREFEWMQQLSQARAQVIEAQRQAEHAHAELARVQQAASVASTAELPPALGRLVINLIQQGVIAAEDVQALGVMFDGLIDAEIACPQCAAQETDLATLNGHVELACTACGHQSGMHASRALALAHFVRRNAVLAQ